MAIEDRWLGKLPAAVEPESQQQLHRARGAWREVAPLAWLQNNGHGSKPMPFWDRSPPIFVYFRGGWDVRRGYEVLTHGQCVCRSYHGRTWAESRCQHVKESKACRTYDP